DYGNVYLYRNQDFSFTKYDSLGKQLGQMMLTVPYKIQSVQNPLNIVLFSQNAQEIHFIDQNLIITRKIPLSNIGFIKKAYAEDLQQVWLLDDSMKRLVQYNFRENIIINSFPFFMDYEDIKDMLVFENQLFILTEQDFKVYNFKAEKLFEAKVENPRKLRRENGTIFIISEKSIFKYLPYQSVNQVFEAKDAKIVDKNSSSYFELKGTNLYLYNP
ncbi:MAG: hypothetical protein Q4G16_11405, partial [Cruoricaptor ignavus]|nr:hypothetical protein [Cruoricaptor ignavus]